MTTTQNIVTTRIAASRLDRGDQIVWAKGTELETIMTVIGSSRACASSASRICIFFEGRGNRRYFDVSERVELVVSR